MSLPPHIGVKNIKDVIPFLPGNQYEPTLNTYAKTSTLGFKAGIPTAKLDFRARNGQMHNIESQLPKERIVLPKDFSSTWTHKKLEFSYVDGDIGKGFDGTYKYPRSGSDLDDGMGGSGGGRGSASGSRNSNFSSIRTTFPPHIAYDKIVLAFKAYFKEPVHESRTEKERVREVEIYYYMEDDSISINEPEQMNSGIVQGTFLKRHRIPHDEEDENKGFIGVDDLDIGKDVWIYGRVFHIYDANDSTRDFIRDTYKRELAPREEIEYDEHHRRRDVIESHIRVSSKDINTKFRKFVKYDRNVLRYNAFWHDTKPFGEKRYFALHYFLADNTIEILEMRKRNSGHDPFPAFVRRQRVPRDGSTPLMLTDQNFVEYKPEDLAVGKTLKIFGRDYLLYDNDEFTKKFCKENFGMDEVEPIKVYSDPAEIKHLREIPPYLGFGGELDELATCFNIQPKPWPRDYFKLLVHDKDAFHFQCRVEGTTQLDSERRFVLTFFLADDTLSVYEPDQRNLGAVTGKVMERARHYKPDSNVFYNAADFYVGAVVRLRERNYVLLDCDRHTLQMQREMGLPTGPDSVRIEAEYRLRLLLSDDIAKVKQNIQRVGGKLPVGKFFEMLTALNHPPTFLEEQALCDVWCGRPEGEGGQGEQACVDVDRFLAALTDTKGLLSGDALRTHIPVPIETINLEKTAGTGAFNPLNVEASLGQPANLHTRALYGQTSVVSSYPGGVGQLKDALHTTAAVSIHPMNPRNLTVTTRGTMEGEVRPRPASGDNITIPHSSGVMSGILKRSLLEGESEADFRDRLKREKKIVQAVVERINLKHSNYTTAFSFFTQNRTKTIMVEKFKAQLLKFNLLQKISDMDVVVHHFFGDDKEIGYQEFLRAMHPEETPITFWSAVAPDES